MSGFASLGHPFIPGLQGLGRALAFLLKMSKAFKSAGLIAGMIPPFFRHLAKASTVYATCRAI